MRPWRGSDIIDLQPIKKQNNSPGKRSEKRPRRRKKRTGSVQWAKKEIVFVGLLIIVVVVLVFVNIVSLRTTNQTFLSLVYTQTSQQLQHNQKTVIPSMPSIDSIHWIDDGKCQEYSMISNCSNPHDNAWVQWSYSSCSGVSIDVIFIAWGGYEINGKVYHATKENHLLIGSLLQQEAKMGFFNAYAGGWLNTDTPHDFPKLAAYYGYKAVDTKLN